MEQLESLIRTQEKIIDINMTVLENISAISRHIVRNENYYIRKENKEWKQEYKAKQRVKVYYAENYEPSQT